MTDDMVALARRTVDLVYAQPDPLKRLRDLAELRLLIARQLDDAMDTASYAARAQGISAARCADALGLSSSAHTRRLSAMVAARGWAPVTVQRSRGPLVWRDPDGAER